jgi:hypothetical protein
MVDLPSAAQEPREPLVYRPISGLALVGFVLGALFAGTVAFSTLLALVQGMPVFLPEALSLGLAATAAVLCFVAQVRIRNSEGTLAGLALARWGLRLSVLLGVTYFVYTWVSGLALAKQANDFLISKDGDDSGFFPRLMAVGKDRTELYQAFLLSLPTTGRGGSKATNPEAMEFRYNQPGKDGEPGNITKFANSPLVMALVNNPDAKIEPLGVVRWEYKGQSFHVLRNYRLTTPEMVIEATVPAQSTEATAEGEQRKWFVPMTKMQRFQPVKYTPLGYSLYALRKHAKLFLDGWAMKVLKGEPVPEYNEADTDWTKIMPKKELQRDELRMELGAAFRGEAKRPARLMIHTDENFTEWSARDDRIRIRHPARMMLGAAKRDTGLVVELEIVTETDQTVDLQAPVPREPPWTWKIREIKVIRAAPAQPSGPAGQG